MWKLLVCINSIKCMIRNRCLFLPFKGNVNKTSSTTKLGVLFAVDNSYYLHSQMCLIAIHFPKLRVCCTK